MSHRSIDHCMTQFGLNATHLLGRACDQVFMRSILEQPVDPWKCLHQEEHNGWALVGGLWARHKVRITIDIESPFEENEVAP